MTKEQFVQYQQKAFTANLKTKFTPGILCHIAIFMLRRNNLTEAQTRINRAIEINSKILDDKGVMTHESYYKLFVYKALILAKSKAHEESEAFMEKALKIKQDTFGNINIYEHVAWRTERLAMIGQSKYEEMFVLICEYIELYKESYCKIAFKDDAFLKYQFLLKIAPDILTLHEC